MARINLTISEKDLRYLRVLVKSGEASSVSHAVRKIIREYQRLKLASEKRLEAKENG